LEEEIRGRFLNETWLSIGHPKFVLEKKFFESSFYLVNICLSVIDKYVEFPSEKKAFCHKHHLVMMKDNSRII
jgi:hypothetical protein